MLQRVLCFILVLTIHRLVAGATGPVPEEWVGRWRADLEMACREMPARHPDLFRTLSREEFETGCRRIAEDVPTLSHAEIVVRLAGLVARVGDGHTRLTLPVDPTAGFFLGHSPTAEPKIPGFRHYPVRLERLADGYLVSRAGPGLERLLGARVTAISGRPMTEVEEAIGPVVHHDNRSRLHDLLPSFIVVPEVLAARGVVADAVEAPWTFVRRDGAEETVRLAPVARGVAVAWRKVDDSGPLPLHHRHPERKFWYEPLDGRETIYVRFAEVADEPDETVADFAARLYRRLQESSTRRLILDLRGNPGGNNWLNPPLVRGLVRAERLWEPGGLFVITNGGTFSAAMNLANDLERLTPAVFVGEATGAPPNHFSDARKLVLPETGLTLRISTLYAQDSAPNDEREAIEPLLPASPTITDYLAGRDPALESLQSYERPAGPPSGTWQGRLSIAYRHLALTLVLDASLAGEVSIPDMGVAGAPLTAMKRSGALVRGRVRMEGREAPIAMKIAGDRMVGWFDHLGRPFPFVAEREQ